MEPLLAAIAGVPWQHWAVLAVVSWSFSLVCLIGYYRPRATTERQSRAYLQLVPRRSPDDLLLEHDEPYHPDRRAA